MNERLVLGMTVDAVNAVVEVKLDDVEPAPPFGNPHPANFHPGHRPAQQPHAHAGGHRAPWPWTNRASHPVSG